MDENKLVLELEVDQTASKNLIDAARWARFFAIFLFVGMACIILLFVSFQSRLGTAFSDYIPGMTGNEGVGIILVILIVIFALVSIFLFFLLRGANLIKKGVETKNQAMLNDGLKSLKTYFTIYGVLAVLGLLSNLLRLTQ